MIVSFLFIIFSSFSCHSQELSVKTRFSLPGDVGKKIEQIKIDSHEKLLYIAHQGADQVEVVSLEPLKFVKAIRHAPGVSSIEIAKGKIYTSNQKDHEIAILDLETLKSVKKFSSLQKPSAMLYVADFKKLYVTDEVGRSLTIIDVRSDRVLKTLHFESQTGMLKYDSTKEKIFLNLPDQNFLAMINPKKDAVEGEYNIDKCSGNRGLALDSDKNLAFVGCEVSDSVIVFDLVKHKTIADFKVKSGIGELAYDPDYKRLYAVCDSGVISSFQVDDNDIVTKLADFKIDPKVRNIVLDADTHTLIYAESEAGGKPTSQLVFLSATR